MKAEEVELILIQMASDGEQTLAMKFYKDGTTIRQGSGTKPHVRISAMSKFDDSIYFDRLMDWVTKDILEEPIILDQDTRYGYKEYVVIFFGESKNGIHGEGAKWNKATGHKVTLSHMTNLIHPIMDFFNNITNDAIRLTNEWYLDAAILARHDLVSSSMPGGTYITKPRLKDDIDTDYEICITQIAATAEGGDITEFLKNKTYTKGGKEFKALLHQTERVREIQFEFIGPAKGAPLSTHQVKKPWWRFGF